MIGGCKEGRIRSFDFGANACAQDDRGVGAGVPDGPFGRAGNQVCHSERSGAEESSFVILSGVEESFF